ncbi:fibronectin type III domain-containing protein [Pseudonocardia sp. GCM10023141]|uniref:fibronectin type III domain-containing protein n=1 Tax=Pseudonocardia sp. GCM10023141 TaxID=3252653 RepID=UPI00360C75A5
MSSEASRRRIPGVLLSIGLVLAVVVSVMVATGGTSPAIAFQQAGHWVFNRSESSVVHIDSGTHQVDARVLVPGAATDAAFAVQGEKQGFLVGRQSITVFGKSTLTVDATLPTGQTELPIGLEVVGGPYLVYRQAGTLVRLGLPPLSVQVGGPVGRPVSTSDGTVWLHRPDNGAICAMRRGLAALDCGLETTAGAPGSLTVLSDAPTFVDTARDSAQIIESSTLTAGVGIGVDLPEGALIGDRDTQGRLPAVVTGPNRLVLIDSSGIPAGRPGGPAIEVMLGDGQFTAPVASDGIVAVIEQARNRLLTFGIDGRPLGTVDLPPGGGAASIARGEDGRIYVDDANGSVTHIVGTDGSVTSVKTGGVVSAVVAASPDQAVPIQRESSRDSPRAPPQRTPTLDPKGPVPSQSPGPPPREPDPPPTPIPGAPAGVKAVAKPDGTVAVSWNAVAGAGVRYDVRVDGNGVAQFAGTSASIPGLVVGREYTITVSATNVAGSGPESAGVTVTPFGAADAPGDFSAVRVGGSVPTVTVSWTPPDLSLLFNLAVPWRDPG